MKNDERNRCRELIECATALHNAVAILQIYTELAPIAEKIDALATEYDDRASEMINQF